MSTNANPEPAEKTLVSAKLKADVQAYMTASVKMEIARDKVNQTAKTECVKLGITDTKALTILLFACGMNDGRTISEVCKFVFPANAENRDVLDEILEKNAKETDHKKRISKKVLLHVARSKEPITLEEAKAAVAKDASPNAGNTRTPGGQTNQTASGTSAPTPAGKKKTAKEIEDEQKNAICAALAVLKREEYTEEDANNILAECLAIAFPEEGDDAESETETE